MALAMVLAWNTAVGRKSFEVYEEGDKVEKIFKEYKEKEEEKKPTGTWIAEKVDEPAKQKPVVKKKFIGRDGTNALGPNDK